MKAMMDGDKEIKVFQVSDTDWWAGRNAATVKAAYIEFNNIGEDKQNREDHGVFETPEELSDESMDRLKYCDDDDMNIKRTFRQQLQKLIDEQTVLFPVFFASTEF